MKSLKAIIGALAMYFVSFVLVWMFWSWFFKEPWEWDNFISLATSVISLLVALGTSVGIDSPSDAPFPLSARIVSYLIAVFWVVMFISEFVVDIDDRQLEFLLYEMVGVKIPCVISVLWASMLYCTEKNS